MANPGRGEVALVVGAGVEVTLRFTTGALSSLQQAMGFPHSAEGCAAFFQRLAHLVAADWALLLSYAGRASQPDLANLDVAGALLDLDLAAHKTAIVHALTIAFPEPAREDQKSGELFTYEALMRSALRAGMTEPEFWRSTPRVISEVVKASTWRRDDEMTRLYLNAALSRSGAKLPPLKEFLMDPSSLARAVVVDANAHLLRFAQMYGGTVHDRAGNVVVDAGNVVSKKDAN